MNILADCGTDIHRPLETSEAKEPTIASISMGAAYEHPTRKEAKASVKKLLHKVRTTKEMQQRITEIEIALALLHLSPILPKPMPSNAEPRKVMHACTGGVGLHCVGDTDRNVRMHAFQSNVRVALLHRGRLVTF